jgi:N-methylhydantoinase B/oxoprolinase/acetone carboxylase alpha subunit
LLRADGLEQPLPGSIAVELAVGDGVRIATPGGGGYGVVDAGAPAAVRETATVRESATDGATVLVEDVGP